MHNSGKTPLLRARNLEKLFDVGEIYIKLEGANPTGHKHDRIAEILVKDALAHGYSSIIIDGSHSYINSVKHFAEIESLKVIIPIFKNEALKIKRFSIDETIKLKKAQHELPIMSIKSYAQERESYIAVEGYSSTYLSQLSLQGLTEEIITKMDYNIDTIFTQLGYGYTLTSIYSTMLRYWIDGKIKKFPKVICGTSPKIHQIYEYYAENNRVQNQKIRDEISEDYQKSIFQMDERLLVESLQAVYETQGEIQQVNDELLKEGVKLLRKYEQLNVRIEECYPFSSFLHMIKTEKISKGKHVIILNEAKSIVNIDVLNSYDEISKETLVEYTRRWLSPYSDATSNTEEAIQNAMEKGFILISSRNEKHEGICVIVNMGFKHFHPTYHLAYIGTERSSKGRGLATELIQRALDLTGGNLSLHVDLDNKGAKKLYEKLGFKHYYNRMIYDNNNH